ncbi:hypothetical protein B0H67DRAFT_316638 [Lasiosphaeris hirsuta]|uniref:Uncharacterized protein n=1 Tax=Lasiosphaeris hirsuta TaxID=260670 RepID=A0AA40A1K5_9PEZI|nr:hypothetical protein B0H67DRAFT_316638 [Lasiosphaeris hirsuta]
MLPGCLRRKVGVRAVFTPNGSIIIRMDLGRLDRALGGPGARGDALYGVMGRVGEDGRGSSCMVTSLEPGPVWVSAHCHGGLRQGNGSAVEPCRYHRDPVRETGHGESPLRDTQLSPRGCSIVPSPPLGRCAHSRLMPKGRGTRSNPSGGVSGGSWAGGRGITAAFVTVIPSLPPPPFDGIPGNGSFFRHSFREQRAIQGRLLNVASLMSIGSDGIPRYRCLHLSQSVAGAQGVGSAHAGQ